MMWNIKYIFNIKYGQEIRFKKVFFNKSCTLHVHVLPLLFVKNDFWYLHDTGQHLSFNGPAPIGDEPLTTAVLTNTMLYIHVYPNFIGNYSNC